MDVPEHINQKKKFYQHLLDFLDQEEENEENSFKKNFEKIKSDIAFLNEKTRYRMEIKCILRLILKISNNHRRTAAFDYKINEIILYFVDEIKQTLSNIEIFDIFKNNKRIILFLFQKQILTIEDSILNFILNHSTYRYFFYPEIKPHITSEKQKTIENELLSIDPDIFTEFEFNRRQGENSTYLCKLIRDDSVEDFISYVNRQNYPLSGEIPKSLFETNSLFEKNGSSLIEYSAFYGSIQIFQYLRLNGIQITEKVWLYSIHSRNGELFHLINENYVDPNDEIYEELMNESIKCHHNDFSEFIESNFLNKKTEKTFESSIRYLNYFYFPENIDKNSPFYYLFKYDQEYIVNIYFDKNKESIENEILMNSKDYASKLTGPKIDMNEIIKNENYLFNNISFFLFFVCVVS